MQRFDDGYDMETGEWDLEQLLVSCVTVGTIGFIGWAWKKYPTFPFLVSLWMNKLKGYIIIAGIGIFLWLLISISWQLTAKQ